MNRRTLRTAPKEWLGRFRSALELAAPRRYLFVMSHMRSYSSLLCHILNSNPQVAGYVEMHESYTTSLDLFQLTMRVRELTGERLRSGQYVLDKLLFNYDISDRMLSRDDIVMLFTIREPEQAIRSIIAMGRKRKKPDWKSRPDKVVSYYARRLDRMSQLARAKPRRSLYFEADQLIKEAPPLLAALDRFLELRQPLRPSYETFTYTGKPKFGDPSKFISSGRIVRERRDYADVDVPSGLMDKAWTAFEDARKVLADACEVDASRSFAERATRPW